ncbi:hypothetical protein ACTFIV_010381 [Dictyostelium citrinum]
MKRQKRMNSINGNSNSNVGNVYQEQIEERNEKSNKSKMVFIYCVGSSCLISAASMKENRKDLVKLWKDNRSMGIAWEGGERFFVGSDGCSIREYTLQNIE